MTGGSDRGGVVTARYGRLISHPRIYQAQVVLTGRDRLEAAMAPVVSRAQAGRTEGVIVDVGGGTARARSMWPAGWRYISVDPDERHVDDHGGDDQSGAGDQHAAVDVEGLTIERVVGGAESIPLPDACAHNVLMSAMSHHLDDAQWSAALGEVERILEPGGALVFVDGVFSRWNPVSRLGWVLDAGRHPRRLDRLVTDLSSRFTIESMSRLTLLHDSVIVLARRRDH
jgi:SAM-dependent methyltransferase